MNKILFITGASRGIGAAIARACAPLFDHLILTYRKQKQAATALAAELDSHCKIDTLALDVSDETSVLQVFEHIDKLPGTLSGLVNNAGIVAPSTNFTDLTKERIENMFATNVFSVFFCCREAVKRMKAGGSIVNISSMASRYGSPGEYVDYAASKGAVDTLTLGLAKEVAAQRIRVNAVRPGLIDTDIHGDSGDRQRPFKLQHVVPMQRPGEASEVASAVRWLLSDESSYVTGAFIDVSGGR